MGKKYTKLIILVLILIVFADNNIFAESIKKDKYEINISDLNEVVQIKEFEDNDHNNLIKDYTINNIEYKESNTISYYLNNKTQMLMIKNDIIQNKSTYKNNKITNYVKYESNTKYDISNISNSKFYAREYNIKNNNLISATTYFADSSKINKSYVMHDNIKFDYTIKGYKNIYYYNDNGNITKRNYYSKIDKLSKKYYYYSGATKDNLAKKIKYRKAYNNKGYLTSYLSYFENNNYKTYITYYSKTKDNSKKNKHRKYVVKSNSKGYITSKTLKSNNKQRLIRKYYYKNADLFNNEKKNLTEIKYYTYNRGKNKYTGNKKYKNGKRISSYVMLKNVPYYNQMNEGYSSGCEFFSLKMALAYKGKTVSSATLYKKLNKSMSKPYYKNGKWHWANPDKKFLGDPKGVMAHNRNWGINPKGLKLLGDQYRDTVAKDNFSIESIRSELLKGNPVIVWSSFNWVVPAGYFYYIDSDGNKRFTYGKKALVVE